MKVDPNLMVTTLQLLLNGGHSYVRKCSTLKAPVSDICMSAKAMMIIQPRAGAAGQLSSAYQKTVSFLTRKRRYTNVIGVVITGDNLA